MSEFKSSNFTNEDNSGGPDLVGVTTFTSPYYFVPPSGTTAQRPLNAVPGQLRFNTDIGRLEVWRGDHWATILGESPSLNGGARGLWAGGYSPGGSTDEIRYINIASTGDTQDFGDLVGGAATGSQGGTASSSTRGLFMSGGGKFNIDFITIASTGNSQNFGNSTIVNGTYS